MNINLFTHEQIKRSPFLLANYAHKISKGKLPNDLHDAMVLHGMIDAKNWYVRCYFDKILLGLHLMSSKMTLYDFGIEKLLESLEK
jgi:hypothetical protein